MSQSFFLGDQSVPLDLWIFVNSIAQTGITTAPTVSVRNRDNDRSLDFSDNLLKTFGSAVSAVQTLSAISGGLYRTTFNSTRDQNIGNGTTLVAEYRDNNGRRTSEDITFTKAPAGPEDVW